jgi:hypothetical protein
MRFPEAIQLHRTLQALANLLPSDVTRSPERYGTALALCHSCLMHLYDPFACTESNHGQHTVEETEMQTISIAGMKTQAAEVLQFSQLVHMSMNADPAATSPLIGDCLYFGATIYAWLANESGLKSYADAYHRLRAVLQTMSTRWVVARRYLDLLDTSKKFTYAECQLL